MIQLANENQVWIQEVHTVQNGNFLNWRCNSGHLWSITDLDIINCGIFTPIALKTMLVIKAFQ
jgi:hypothetical protein